MENFNAQIEILCLWPHTHHHILSNLLNLLAHLAHIWLFITLRNLERCRQSESCGWRRMCLIFHYRMDNQDRVWCNQHDGVLPSLRSYSHHRFSHVDRVWKIFAKALQRTHCARVVFPLPHKLFLTSTHDRFCSLYKQINFKIKNVQIFNFTC